MSKNINLNLKQEEAVNHIKGPLRIVAGPGSGKTRTIVSKIAYILKNGLANQDEILTITFTNKASNEIRERVREIINREPKNIFTYHGWCNFFLRNEAEEIGMTKDFSILDMTDVGNKVKNLLKENDDSLLEKKEVINAFDKIAREELNLKEMEISKNSSHIMISKLWKRFNEEKKANGQLDFNDLLIEVKKLLISNSQIAEKWKNKYKYVFIDEFQDTNNVQFEIIKAITNSDSNITVVGDPDQNIYSWRGANIDLINNFSKWFPDTKTILLDTNYRSTEEIINASNNLIRNNKNRVSDFFSKPHKENGSSIEIIEKENDFEEAFAITNKINKFIRNGYEYQDIAIIIRSSYKTRPIETALNHQNIPYRVIGAMKFFDRAEVRQTMKFLLFAARQSDSNLLDIINVPPKKFGPKKIIEAKLNSSEANQTIWEYMNENIDLQMASIKEWIGYTNIMISSIQNGERPLIVMEEYLENIKYIERLFDEPNRKQNIKETLKIIDAAICVKNKKSITEKIIEFHNKSILSSSSDKTTENGEINIITAHASKGTEFPIVFIYSMTEGHLPSNQAIENNKIEEERRVAYVAMTRAMDNLLITTSNGFTNYNREIVQSRFIDEILSINTYNYNNESPDQMLNLKQNLNEKISQSNIGNNVYHNLFGKGKIIDNDGEFITVKFNDGKNQEILLGHKSYKVIE